MFTGLTATEFARRARTAPDQPPEFHPDRGDLLECEGWSDIHDGTAIFAKRQRIVYGVGCKPDFVQYLCDTCYEQNSEDADDEFWCEGCDEPHATNTSWESHYADVDGQMLCLKCAAERVREKANFWITRPNQVTEACVRKAPHFIPDLFDDLEEFDGDTADSMTGATRRHDVRHLWQSERLRAPHPPHRGAGPSATPARRDRHDQPVAVRGVHRRSRGEDQVNGHYYHCVDCDVPLVALPCGDPGCPICNSHRIKYVGRLGNPCTCDTKQHEAAS